VGGEPVSEQELVEAEEHAAVTFRYAEPGSRAHQAATFIVDLASALRFERQRGARKRPRRRVMTKLGYPEVNDQDFLEAVAVFAESRGRPKTAHRLKRIARGESEAPIRIGPLARLSARDETREAR
jgi:hypothetical protein